MAKFLDANGVSNELSQIVKNAKERLILISPYLQFSPRFKELLEGQNKKKLPIIIIYRESRLPPGENRWLNSLKSVRTNICKNLHAKCYLNEKEALISSMNLYQFSQENNNEMGIAVSKSDDLQLYSEICEEVDRLLMISEDGSSEEIKVTIERVTPKEESSKRGEGHCIRCGNRIELDPTRPYCFADYQKWKKLEDETYVEKNGFCHMCGKPHASSIEKPVCLSCYKKNKKLFEDF